MFATCSAKAMLNLPRYIRIRDEFEDVLLSVELVARLLPETEQEPLLWKRVILAVHNGLQGAMVSALSGTDGTGALSTKSQKKVFEWMETQKGPHPEPQMALFGTLMDRASDPKRVRDGPALTTTDDEVHDLERLHKLRRNFAHFTPKGWSIESAGLPRIVLVAVDGIERLMLQNDRVLAHLGERRERLVQSIESIRASLI